MFITAHFLISLVPLLMLAVLGWSLSLKDNNVTVVDSLWAMFFFLATATNLCLASALSNRAYFIMALVTIWAFRLSFYLHRRNHNKPEDLRYQAIRARNEPNFRIKSLYLVFMLQAVLAWIISLPLHVATQSTQSLNVADYAGLAIWLVGMGFQVTADMQLATFKSNPLNAKKVLNTGVWRYTRHPNYFGEACIWFGYGFIALGTGTWWALSTPIFMAYLLIKVTGAKLLEKDIAQRRPDYATYVQKTSEFIPWIPKR